LLLVVATEEWTTRKTTKSPGEKIVKDIKRATRKHCSSEEKIRIVLDGLHGEDNETLSAIGPRTMVEC
jgi:transposase